MRRLVGFFVVLGIFVSFSAPAWAKPKKAAQQAAATAPEAAAPAAAAPAGSEPSLYARLGGEAAIRAVVDDFVPRAAANPAVNFTRKGHARTWDPTPENVAKLKASLTMFICMATGGPQEYAGKEMSEAHKGMQITDDEFAAMVMDLQSSLVALGVPQRERDELIMVAGSTRGTIVEKRPSPIVVPAAEVTAPAEAPAAEVPAEKNPKKARK